MILPVQSVRKTIRRGSWWKSGTGTGPRGTTSWVRCPSASLRSSRTAQMDGSSCWARRRENSTAFLAHRNRAVSRNFDASTRHVVSRYALPQLLSNSLILLSLSFACYIDDALFTGVFLYFRVSWLIIKLIDWLTDRLLNKWLTD